jgi:hypothetical protein
MISMAQAVRKNSQNPMVIAGAYQYAYDADSLISLKALEPFKDDQNLIWNFHPYQGPSQAGAKNKNADGFEAMI